jgi:hypothetical protein
MGTRRLQIGASMKILRAYGTPHYMGNAVSTDITSLVSFIEKSRKILLLRLTILKSNYYEKKTINMKKIIFFFL